MAVARALALFVVRVLSVARVVARAVARAVARVRAVAVAVEVMDAFVR